LDYHPLSGESAMSNRLLNQLSPYLQHHAHNPVDWFPWGEEAFQKAIHLDRPIFLSIGYAACHWCHVMERESFEDPATAALLNAGFVCIKVDREERPDIDQIYMAAVVAMTGQGGWPTSIFLTPERKPFFGGTYFPPQRLHGMPSFQDILLNISQAWRENRKGVEEAGQTLTQHLKQIAHPENDTSTPTASLLSKAQQNLLKQYDWQNGGFGNAPKFPQPMAIEFLLFQASRGVQQAQDAAVHNLERISRGGIFDVIGGGFHRYSIDKEWLIPHFEKMLYDNALLARNYVHAYLMTGRLDLKWTCIETLDFIAREMQHKEGGFFSSCDADSEGEEGKYYLWKHEEIRSILSDASEFERFQMAYEIPEEGNFHNKIILRRKENIYDLASLLKADVNELTKSLSRSQRVLQQERSKRSKPMMDDKIIVSWNALMCRAFCEAARTFSRPDYLAIACKNAEFIWERLFQNHRLMRIWRNGKVQGEGFLEDYASLILAFLELYQTDLQPRWYERALELGEILVEEFTNADGEFEFSGKKFEALISSPRDTQDNAIPSGSSQASIALHMLSLFEDISHWKEISQKNIEFNLMKACRYPLFYSNWLIASDLFLGPVDQISLVWDKRNPNFEPFAHTLHESFKPRTILVGSSVPSEWKKPAILQGKTVTGQTTTAYICRGFVCSQPISVHSIFKQRLDEIAF
jgi:uncharacterized protein